MDKTMQHFLTVLTFICALALQITLTGIGLEKFIDVTTMIIIVGIFIVGYYHYKEHMESLAIGGGILGFLITFVAILANLSDPSDLPSALAVGFLCMLYAVVGYYFIYSTFIIYKDDNDIEIKEYSFDINDASLMVSVVTIVSLTILLTGAGLGSYLDVPSMIGVLAIFGAYFIKNHYKRLKVMKNYVVGYSYVMALSTTVMVLSSEFKAEEIGPIVAIMVLSMISMYILYFVYLKKQLIFNDISTLKIDIALGMVSLYIFLFLFGVFLINIKG